MPPQRNETSRSSSSRFNAWLEMEIIPLEKRLRAWLISRFPGRSDIDDVVQETYTRLLRSSDLMEIRHPKSYFFATARNLTMDRVRKESRSSLESLSELPEKGFSLLEDRSEQQDAESRDRKLDILEAAIQSLPERCREIIILRKQHKMSHDEIARQLGISKNTVNAHITQGMKKCREYFKDQGLLTEE